MYSISQHVIDDCGGCFARDMGMNVWGGGIVDGAYGFPRWKRDFQAWSLEVGAWSTWRVGAEWREYQLS
jgi:hypothetical protein